MSSYTSSNSIDMFDCLADLYSQRIKDSRLVKWKLPPLKELLCDRISGQTSWTPLIPVLLERNFNIPDITSLLLARALYHNNTVAVTRIVSRWRWEELKVTYPSMVVELCSRSSLYLERERVESLLVDAFVAAVLYKYDNIPVEMKPLRVVDISSSNVPNYNHLSKLLEKLSGNAGDDQYYTSALTKVEVLDIKPPDNPAPAPRNVKMCGSSSSSESGDDNFGLLVPDLQGVLVDIDEDIPSDSLCPNDQSQREVARPPDNSIEHSSSSYEDSQEEFIGLDGILQKTDICSCSERRYFPTKLTAETLKKGKISSREQNSKNIQIITHGNELQMQKYSFESLAWNTHYITVTVSTVTSKVAQVSEKNVQSYQELAGVRFEVYNCDRRNWVQDMCVKACQFNNIISLCFYEVNFDGKLGDALSEINLRELKFLTLRSTIVTGNDLVALTRSLRNSSLRSLVIAKTNLGNVATELVDLIRSVSGTVESVCLGKCVIVESSVQTLFQTFKMCQKLKALDISWSIHDNENLSIFVHQCESLGCLPELVLLVVAARREAIHPDLLDCRMALSPEAVYFRQINVIRYPTGSFHRHDGDRRQILIELRLHAAFPN